MDNLKKIEKEISKILNIVIDNVNRQIVTFDTIDKNQGIIVQKIKELDTKIETVIGTDLPAIQGKVDKIKDVQEGIEDIKVEVSRYSDEYANLLQIVKK